MSNLEQELSALRRRPVPSTLDARVARTLQDAAPLLVRPVPAWACAAAALAGLVAGAVLDRFPAAPTQAGGAVTLLAAHQAAAPEAFPFFGRRFVEPAKE